MLTLVMPPDLVAPSSDAGHPRFLIDGWPAEVLVWTAEEWSRLPVPDRPGGAQRCANGCWATLQWANDTHPSGPGPDAAAGRSGLTLFDPGDRP